MRGAVIDESFSIGIGIRSDRFGVTADFQAGIHGLQRERGFLIKRVKLVRCAGPETCLGLVPEFPVADVVVKSVRPSLVIVHGDMFHDVGILVEIRRRIDVVCAPTATDAVVHLAAGFVNGS